MCGEEGASGSGAWERGCRGVCACGCPSVCDTERERPPWEGAAGGAAGRQPFPPQLPRSPGATPAAPSAPPGRAETGGRDPPVPRGQGQAERGASPLTLLKSPSAHARGRSGMVGGGGWGWMGG